MHIMYEHGSVCVTHVCTQVCVCVRTCVKEALDKTPEGLFYLYIPSTCS